MYIIHINSKIIFWVVSPLKQEYDILILSFKIRTTCAQYIIHGKNGFAKVSKKI